MGYLREAFPQKREKLNRGLFYSENFLFLFMKTKLPAVQIENPIPINGNRPWVTPEIIMISKYDILSGSTPVVPEGNPEPFFPFKLGSAS